tara:strand:- start:177 stop:656 length:480 start_codon:yes stop_codon:yes gene_type:complete
MDFLTSGGVIGNLIRGLGQRFGFGKTYDQPTYDMSRLSGLPLGGTATFENLDIRDKFDRTTDDDDSEIVDKYNEYLIDGPPNPLTFKEFKNAIESIQKGTLPNTTTSMLPTTLVADTKVNNKNILRNLFNPKLNLNEAIDKEDEKQKRQEDLLEEIMKA